MEAPAEVKLYQFFNAYFASLSVFIGVEKEHSQTVLEERVVNHLIKNYGMLRVSAEVEVKERFRAFLWKEVQKIEREHSQGRGSS